MFKVISRSGSTDRLHCLAPLVSSAPVSLVEQSLMTSSERNAAIAAKIRWTGKVSSPSTLQSRQYWLQFGSTDIGSTDETESHRIPVDRIAPLASPQARSKDEGLIWTFVKTSADGSTEEVTVRLEADPKWAKDILKRLSEQSGDLGQKPSWGPYAPLEQTEADASNAGPSALNNAG